MTREHYPRFRRPTCKIQGGKDTMFCYDTSVASQCKIDNDRENMGNHKIHKVIRYFQTSP